MNEINELKPSFWQVFAISTTILLLGLASLYFAITVTINLYSSANELDSIIIFNKAGFYFFGIAIVLLVFPFVVIYTKVFKLKISKHKEIWLNFVLLFGILLTLAAPHFTHYYFESYILKSGYEVCKEKSNSALYIVTVVYAKPGYC